MARKTYDSRNGRRRPFEGHSTEWCQWLMDELAAARNYRRTR